MAIETAKRGRPRTKKKGYKRSDDIIWVNTGPDLKKRCREAAANDDRELTQWCRTILKKACDKAGVK